MRAGLLRLPNLIHAATDRDLLRRFADARDEPAFAELVRRHGSLVLAVCRRVVSDPHLADDAFQATFVVLARKPASAGVGSRLSTWLHSVAVKVSLRARTMVGRRAKRETLTAAVPERGTTPSPADDTAAVVDEEIAALPEHLRAAVVLCELRGVGRRDAARELGIAEGTLSSRLAAARKKLAERLRARGLAPAAGVLAAALVPSDLAAAAVALSTGKAELSHQLIQLVEGGMKMALLTKLKLTAVAALFAVLAAGGFGTGRSGEADAADRRANAPVPKATYPNGLIWVMNDGTFEMVAFAPDGTKVTEFRLKDGPRFLGMTGDGKKLAFVGRNGKSADPKETDGLTVHLRDIGPDLDGTDTGLKYEKDDFLIWSPDARQVVRHRQKWEVGVAQGEPSYALFNLDTGKEKNLVLPGGHRVLGWSPAGTWLLVGSHELPSHLLSRWHKYTLADGKLHTITPSHAAYGMYVTADGKAIIGYANTKLAKDPTARGAENWRMVRVDVESGEETVLEKFARPDDYSYGWVRPAPTGGRFLFWAGVERMGEGTQDMRLSVHDSDGTEAKLIKRFDYNAWRELGWFPDPKVDLRRRNAPVPKATDAGLLWVRDEQANQLTAYTPALEVAKRVRLPAAGKFLGLTPDGTGMVCAADPEVTGEDLGQTYHIFPLGGGSPTDLGLGHSVWDFPPIWSPDGKKFLRVRKDLERKIPMWNSTIFRYDVFDLASKKATHLADIPHDHWVMAWAADGKKFITQSLRKGEEDTLHEMDFEGKSKPLPAEGKATRPSGLAGSPDGTALLFSSYDSLWAIDAATGKRTELLDKTHGFPKPAWSPDGKRMAVAYCQYLTGKSGDPWDVQRLVVAGTDGTNRKEITLRDRAKGEDAYDVDFLGWFPNRPAPVPVPKRNAPVPKEKEDTKGLTASVSCEKKEIMLGEPVYLTFTVNNPTSIAWQFEEGGDYRNRLGRPNSFTVTVTGPDGKSVPQPDSGTDLGGMSYLVKLPANGKASFQPLFMPHWATFEKPGEYTVTVKRKVGLVPADAEDGFRAKATPVNLSATAKITILPTDKKKMGELIDQLGQAMLDRKSDDCEKATKMLLAIPDPRAIPHYIDLGKLPHPSSRYAACEGLGRFKTDEAFAALRTLYATTGADLRVSEPTQELANSSADAVRHWAIRAILDCGHPDALAFAWKTATDDGYYRVRLAVLHKAFVVKSPEARKVIATLLNDPHESIRNEAKRYTELLAKEDKK